METETKKTELLFAKVRDTATIPSKRDEDGGYDVYADFKEDYIIIEPNELKFITTGIASAFSPEYRIVLRERGSTGSKGMAIRCGVIDSGYRDEWFVCINNTSNKTIIISKLDKKELIEQGINVGEYHTIIYPYSKAIAQALLEETPKADIITVSYETLLTINSERGMGKLGSSKK